MGDARPPVGGKRAFRIKPVPVAVIHNGIVENFVDLRTELLARGHKLRSENRHGTHLASDRGET